MVGLTVDPRDRGIDTFYAPYPLPEAPITAVQLLSRLSPDGQHGQFLLREFRLFLADKEPVDRFGYRMIGDAKQLDGWREYQFRKMASCLRGLEDCMKLMETDNDYGRRYWQPDRTVTLQSTGEGRDLQSGAQAGERSRADG